jgi:hypothetical protein
MKTYLSQKGIGAVVPPRNRNFLAVRLGFSLAVSCSSVADCIVDLFDTPLLAYRNCELL